ncbi:hypothetical protein BH09PLA1_BH09PLA1_23570 [soil metagenome]
MPIDRLAKKLLVIGWDAADWKMISPLVDAGQMPTLAKFLSEGAMGDLFTLRPALSPMLWTSIATGKRADKHGILGFLEPLPDGGGIRIASSTSRKTKAFWNILSQSGLRGQVVSWYASHPAEPINGVCVSNHFGEVSAPLGEPWPLPKGSVHPPEMAEPIATLRVHPAELNASHLLPLIPRAAEINLSEDRRPETAIRLLAQCASVHAVATGLLEAEPWDFAAVYYDAIDLFGHHFMHYHPPKMAHVSERDHELYKDVMTGIYRFHDMMLERLLQLAGPEATVIICSDHGFYSDHLRPPYDATHPGLAAAWHRDYGMIAARGPAIRKDERIYGASVLDIAPTILRLFGLPVGQDMDGKVLIDLIDRPIEIERIATWDDVAGESGMHPPDVQQDPYAASQAVQQLVELGYLAAAPKDDQEAIDACIVEAKFNLASTYVHSERSSKAIAALEELHQKQPTEERFVTLLAQCYLDAERYGDCKRVIEQLLADGREIPNADLLLGIVALSQDDTETAVQHLQRAERATPNVPALHCTIGRAYVSRRRWADAARAFRRALEIDADCAPAHHGLAITMIETGEYQPAVEHALRAVSLNHFFPLAHYHLGVAMAHLGWTERAAKAMEIALSMLPGMAAAHRYLARLYLLLSDPTRAGLHSVAAQKILRDRALKRATAK